MSTSSLGRVLSLLLVGSLLVPASTAGGAGKSQDWDRVVALPQGQKVVVRPSRDSGGKIKGTLQRADKRSVVVLTSQGEVEIEQSEVRQVFVRRGGWGASPWAGAAAGFAILALLTAAEGDFDQPAAALAFGAAGAGLGALAGLGARAIGNKRLIYEAPGPN